MTKQSKFSKISRSCLLVHTDVTYDHRYDLEDNDTSNVWIEIKNKTKNLLIMGGYRQWQLPKKFKLPASKNPSQQKFRFVKTLDKWQLALAEKNMLLL